MEAKKAVSAATPVRKKNKVSVSDSMSGAEKATVSYEDMLKGFNNIPRMTETEKIITKNSSQSMKSDKWTDKSDEKTKAKQAVKDMKRLLVLLEKSIIGEISNKELHEIVSSGQWLESIIVLKEYVETLCLK